MKAGHGMAMVCLALGAAGCSSDSSDYSGYFQIMRQGFTQSFGSDKVTLQQAAAVPYASMGWRLNGGSENLIVLATATGAQLTWTSAAHIVLQTQDGRIVRTVGLPDDLGGLSTQNGPPLSSPSRALKGAYSENRIGDFPTRGQYSVAMTCGSHFVGARMVTILGKKLRTLRVDEDCRRGDERYTDSYWLDPQTGMAWQTVQHLSRDVIIKTEILRPPE